MVLLLVKMAMAMLASKEGSNQKMMNVMMVTEIG